MNDTIETTLLLNLFYFENGTYTKNENFIEAKRRKAIDPDLAQEYAETIRYLETLSDEEYQTKKEELLQQVEVN